MIASHPGQTYGLLSPMSEGSESHDEVETEKTIATNIYMRHLADGPIADLHEANDHYNNAGDALLTQFERHGRMEDLEEAIDVAFRETTTRGSKAVAGLL